MKIRLPPQREHDFDKITVFEKTPKKQPPATCLETKNDQKSTPELPRIAKNCQKNVFLTTRFFNVFLHAKKTKIRKRAVRPGYVEKGRRSSGGRRGGKEG